MADIRVVEVPVARFAIRMVDKPKMDCGVNTANAGFFGNYSEQGDKFTLPVGHLICDYAAESEHTRFYCEQRGKFDGDKFAFDCSKWSYMNENHQGKALSTLVIRGGKASVVDTVELPEADYAISGVPVLRNGGDCKWGAYVSKQGWSAGTVRATWHTFVGIKDDPTVVYVIGMKTTTENMVKSSEAFNALKAEGFVDAIKLDGGGSFYFNDNGKIQATSENRRINTVLDFSKKPLPNNGNRFKIALGAGHYIGTEGKRIPASLDPNQTREWELNDRVCDYIEAKLAKYDGYDLLRTDDTDGEEDVTLTERANAANAWGADFYLSVHHNAGINGGSGGGIVAYTHTTPKGNSTEWRDELYEELAERTGLRGNRANPKTASNLQILRSTDMPSVLLELGFMDSKTDVPVILTDEYAQACADAIVSVIVRRAGLKPKETGAEFATKEWVKQYVAEIMGK